MTQSTTGPETPAETPREQYEVLGRLLAHLSGDRTPGEVFEDLLSRLSPSDDIGDYYTAQWDFWERYGKELPHARRLAPGSVGALLSDADKALRAEHGIFG